MIDLTFIENSLIFGGCDCICAMPDVTVLSGGKNKGLSYTKYGEGLPFPMGEKKDETECETSCYKMLFMKMISCKQLFNSFVFF